MEYLKQYEIFLKKARTDIAAAQTLLKFKNAEIDDEVILFHLQQATEKLLKAFLSFKGQHFSKTHDTELLFERIGDIAPELFKKFNTLSILDEYAVEGRYGDIGEKIYDIEDMLKTVEAFEQAVLLIVNNQK